MSEEDDQTLSVGVEVVAQGGIAVSVRGNRRVGRMLRTTACYACGWRALVASQVR
jgi:hypothetical protein